ncbi:ATP-binding protein [Duganella sp. Root1480D1]|uniref:ATP-binding protein n=1 Tax=Duganella sp. Root1480D1 TaxID=1736471 RepID=UPI00070C375A|nr:ATP-binding protein [Duganella sp. Root1480D1]KQZ44874.1 two-component hybrid sensor and regulator [Duganella sp. Root1480D1]
MKIITRLKWAQWLCVAGVALAILLMIGATRQVRQELQRNERAGEIVSGVVALRYLSLEYAQTQERRSHVQWQLRKDSLQGLLLRDDLFREAEESQLLHDLQENLPLLARHFSELLLVRQELRATPERAEVLHLLEARLFGQLMSRTQDMIRDAEELARRSRQGVLSAQQNATAVAAALGLLLALTVLGALALTIRSVAHPLERLRRGAELVGSGKLDFRMNMKAVDEVGDLARAFDAMTERLRSTTVSRDELVNVNAALHDEMAVRHGAELKVQAQLGRLSLLHQMTRSIGERQDLRSILQVLVRSLEDQLPVDFACVFLLQEGVLEASCVGLGNALLPGDAALKEGAQVSIDNNGLSRCVKGQLVYEPDISGSEFPFPHRLARGGLNSLVLAPLQAESVVFGVLAVARTIPNAFSSGECEFLRQLSEHAALAARQAQLYGALQQAYHTLHATQQSVTREERLRALGQMASGIAHDINNAISPVALYTETLLETETGLSASGRSNLQVIARAIDDVAATVARMRELYRRREPQMELTSVSLNVLAQQVADLTRARWSDMPQQRGVVISMKLELAPGLPSVMGSEPEIREALTNLVFNAVDAMPEGGALTLRTRSTGEHAIVDVVDSGVGMDESTRRHCLDPFFTTKGERGSGLGLATVNSMAERHSAVVQVESMIGQGTTVSLAFPLPQAHLAMPPLEAPATTVAVAEPMRLLVIDDDPAVLASMTTILQRDGHTVVAANGGAAGIDQFRASMESSLPFDAVFSDLGMPHVDGRKVAGCIKELSPNTPVILVTGWGQRLIPEGDVDAKPASVDEVLSKPPRVRELREVLLKVHKVGYSPAS